MNYAVCDDRRTLLWFANQRAVEYHPALVTADRPDRITHLVIDLDPPPGDNFTLAVRTARLVEQALVDTGLQGAVKTSGSKGLHVFIPLGDRGERGELGDPGGGGHPTHEDVAAAARALAERAVRIDPAIATTAFMKDDRGGKVFVDSTRVGGATVVAAYSPRVRPGVPVSFPVAWRDLDDVTPGDFTIHNALDLLGAHDPWAGAMPEPQQLSEDLIAEGHALPVARVQAMHEGRRRKRASGDRDRDRGGG